jgi:hypothetical protein
MQNASSKEEAFNIAASNGVYLPGAPQNSYETRLDANGNLIQLEKDPNGKVVGQSTLSTKTPEGVVSTPEKTASQLDFLLDTAKSALDLAPASGQGGISRTIGTALFGDTKFNRLVGLTNTLRTNVLTLMTDPEIKKFFGPQMSEGDVRLMTSAGTTLNPELQSPEDMATEVNRLIDLLKRMQGAVKVGSAQSDGGVTVTAPDGTPVIITD